MGLLIFNDKALWSGQVGIACGLGMTPFRRNAMLSILVAAMDACLVALSGRIKDGEASPALIHPDSGGHVFFIPVWVIGLIARLESGASWMGWV